jgi:copper transport protein
MDVLWRWLHLIAAGFWIGGLVMLAIVTMAARAAVDRETFRLLIRRIGRAFLVGSMIAWALLAVSGLAMARTRVQSISALGSTAYGRTLAAKSLLFLLAILGTVGHTAAGGRSSPIAIRVSRLLSPIILLLTLAIFYLAVRLAMG